MLVSAMMMHAMMMMPMVRIGQRRLQAEKRRIQLVVDHRRDTLPRKGSECTVATGGSLASGLRYSSSSPSSSDGATKQ